MNHTVDQGRAMFVAVHVHWRDDLVAESAHLLEDGLDQVIRQVLECARFFEGAEIRDIIESETNIFDRGSVSHL